MGRMKRLFASAFVLISAAARAEEAELKDFRCIFHCHSHFSHDSKGTIEEITAAAKKAKVDAIWMTDHPTDVSLKDGPRGDIDGVLYIDGAEDHNLQELDIHDRVKARSPLEAAPQVVKQGGIAIACHPEEYKEEWWGAEGLSGMEIYNLHADVKDEKPEMLPKIIAALKKDPETAILTIFDTPRENLKRWDAMGAKRRFVGVAGNDSHQNQNFLGLQLDPYDRIFRFVNTHVLAKERTREALREGLLAGRVYVAFEIFGDAKGFAFTASGPGGARAGMGDEVASADGWELAAEFPLEANWRFVHDGEVVKKGLGRSARCEVTGPGVWRVEGRRQDPDGQWRPWIFGNPVYIRAK
jgi:hypothetical protein